MILNPSCLMVGIALHQFLHVLGFFHEQSRRDRDKYIRIDYDEINKREYLNPYSLDFFFKQA